MPRKTALLIVNPHCRHGNADMSEARASLRETGWDVIFQSPQDPGRIPELVRRHGGEADVIILGGGDGTMNTAIEALLEVRKPLGVLPLGTANDLARTLGLPQDPLDAIHSLANGVSYAVDLGWVNGKHYFNVASLGISAHMTNKLDPAVKRRWGILGYPVKALEALREARPFTAEVTCDDMHLRLKAVQIAVGNGCYYGGGMRVSEDAGIDDASLDLYAIRPRSLWGYFTLALALRSGRQGHSSGVHMLRGQAITITTRHPQPVNTDGELTTTTPARFRVVPAALPVLVAPDYAARRRKEVTDVTR
ncbi:lipid kinase [Telmatospirillum sp. J64-1]|uniref:lipid kinase n=1 Tax=Telmatospirillum sp. J64-1 TaxID=2502183 RepID=UPI002101E53E|nr:lipid kinase [Telmatospirillum sp. J64-1]